MNRDAINCPSCGKLRKDIYKEKIICYIFCIGGGLLVGFGGPMIKDKKQNFDFNNFNNADTSSGNGLAYTMLIVGIIAALIGLFYYFRISKKLKTYRWR
jgi:hypothetical protein